jgi:hypothetical protein
MSGIFTQGHALIVGVGADLPNTVDDAKGLGDILADQERCGYPPDQVSVCTSEKAIRGNVLSELEKLSKVSKESNVIIYFSGHGYRVKKGNETSYYLMPYGYNVNDLQNAAISSEEFNQRLEKIKAKSILVLLDCCHAGGIEVTKSATGEVLKAPPNVEMTKAPLPPEAPKLFAQGKGRFLIASSREHELSYAGKPYSAFTAALIEALCGQGVKKQDGYVRVTDLIMYTSYAVRERTNKKQNPVTDFRDATDFALAYYAGGDSTPKAPPFTDMQVESVPGELNPNPRITWNIGGDSMIAARDINIKRKDGDRRAGRDYFEIDGNAYINQVGDSSDTPLTTIFSDLRSQMASLSVYVKPIVELTLKQIQDYAEKIQNGDASQSNQEALRFTMEHLLMAAPEIGKLAVSKLSNSPDTISDKIREIARNVNKN